MIDKGKDCPLGDMSGMRPITLLPTLFKAFERLVQSRIISHLCARISPLQRGFTLNGSTIQAIQLLDAVVDVARAEGTPLGILLVDLKAAFDSVPVWLVERGLRRLGVGEHICKLASNLLSPSPLRFITVHGTTEPPFERYKGTPQGSVCSPLWFIVAFDALLCTLEHRLNTKRREAGSETFSTTAGILGVGFADDLTCFVENEDELRVTLQTINAFGDWSGLRLNATKTIATANNTDLLRKLEVAARRDRRTQDITFVAPDAKFTYLGVSRCALGGRVSYLHDVRRLENILRFSRAIAAGRWLPPAVGVSFLNELVGGMMMYSFQSTIPTAADLASIRSLHSRLIRAALRLNRKAHLAMLFEALGTMEFGGRFAAQALHGVLLALAQDELPLSTAAMERRIVAASSGDTLVVAGVGLAGKKKSGWSGVAASLRATNSALVPTGFHPTHTRSSHDYTGISAADASRGVECVCVREKKMASLLFFLCEFSPNSQ